MCVQCKDCECARQRVCGYGMKRIYRLIGFHMFVKYNGGFACVAFTLSESVQLEWFSNFELHWSKNTGRHYIHNIYLSNATLLIRHAGV